MTAPVDPRQVLLAAAALAPLLDAPDALGDDPRFDPIDGPDAARTMALTVLVDRSLPLLRAYAAVAPDAGGPDPDDLVPGADGQPTLPEVVEGEQLLADQEIDHAPMGPIDDLDVPDPDAGAEIRDLPGGDPLLDAAGELLMRTQNLRAHRIAGLDAGAAQTAADAARLALVRAALAEAAAHGLAPALAD